MIWSLVRQGPAASLGQHCPQMTQSPGVWTDRLVGHACRHNDTVKLRRPKNEWAIIPLHESMSAGDPAMIGKKEEQLLSRLQAMKK